MSLQKIAPFSDVKEWTTDGEPAARAYSSLPTAALLDGCTFNVDYTVPEVTVSTGSVRLVDTNVNGGDQSWSTGAFIYEVDSQTVSLTDETTNHIYIEVDRSADDTATIVVNTAGIRPSETSLKIGEVDTTNNTKSEQWSLLTTNGNLTFPQQSAVSSVKSRISDGTVLYARENSTYLFVSDDTVYRLSPWKITDGDTYTLPETDANGISKARTGDIINESGAYFESTVSKTVSGTVSVDVSEANLIQHTVDGDVTYEFSGVSSYVDGASFTMFIEQNGSNSITWPSSVDWNGGSAPNTPSDGKSLELAFISYDGGTTWKGRPTWSNE